MKALFSSQLAESRSYGIKYSCSINVGLYSWHEVQSEIKMLLEIAPMPLLRSNPWFHLPCCRSGQDESQAETCPRTVESSIVSNARIKLMLFQTLITSYFAYCFGEGLV